MKKLLALAALAALTLTGCGGTGGKTNAPPALIQPADYEHDTPSPPPALPSDSHVVWQSGDLTMREVNVITSTGHKMRCLVTSGGSSVAQTCQEVMR